MNKPEPRIAEEFIDYILVYEAIEMNNYIRHLEQEHASALQAQREELNEGFKRLLHQKKQEFEQALQASHADELEKLNHKYETYKQIVESYVKEVRELKSKVSKKRQEIATLKDNLLTLKSLTKRDKPILDPTCSGRSIHFDKNNPLVLYTDIRKMEKGLVDFKRPNWEICPDEVQDFRDLTYPSKSFKIVVFDPPHLKNISMKSVIGKKYGSLSSEHWQSDIQKGFSECMRVLDDWGVLIMKWSCANKSTPSRDIKLKEMLAILPQQPLVGHTSGSKSNTNWICFVKIPEEDLKRLKQ